MTYYQLRCATCDELFKPLVSTEPDELLHPDYAESAEQAGEMNAWQLRKFHEQHEGHALEAVDAEWTRVENDRLVPLKVIR